MHFRGLFGAFFAFRGFYTDVRTVPNSGAKPWFLDSGFWVTVVSVAAWWAWSVETLGAGRQDDALRGVGVVDNRRVGDGSDEGED